MFRFFSVCALSLAATAAVAQTPQPFPQPAQKSSPALPAPAAAKPVGQPKTAPRAEGAPTEAELGAPIYPSAVFLTSYDAGRGQRFYIFGAAVPYADLVGYYKTVLKTKGDELFDQPPTHQFETARFRDETMAFPPGVTIKDYSAGGSAGYPNPKADATPARFPTVIQIVALPR